MLEGHRAFGVSGQFSTSLIPSLSLMGDIVLGGCLNASPVMSLAPSSGFWNLGPKSQGPSTGAAVGSLCTAQLHTSPRAPHTHNKPLGLSHPGLLSGPGQRSGLKMRAEARSLPTSYHTSGLMRTSSKCHPLPSAPTFTSWGCQKESRESKKLKPI